MKALALSYAWSSYVRCRHMPTLSICISLRLKQTRPFLQVKKRITCFWGNHLLPGRTRTNELGRGDRDAPTSLRGPAPLVGSHLPTTGATARSAQPRRFVHLTTPLYGLVGTHLPIHSREHTWSFVHPRTAYK